MFEAMMDQSDLWKRLLEAIKELVSESNLECSPSGIQLQAMDSSHVSLVSMLLRQELFKSYRCERNVNLGISLANMSKILKCANKEDHITLRYEDASDCITFLLESPGQDKVSEFSMKLMEIEGESLGIPEQQYQAIINMQSADFTKLCRDMTIFGECVQISVTREAVRFSSTGDFGTGSTVLKPAMAADVRVHSKVKKEEPSETQAEKGTPEAAATAITKGVTLEIAEPVTLNFALKHLVNFTKAGALAERVKISMAKDVPLVVEYKIESTGYIRFYLAPKVDDETTGAAA